MKFIRLPQWLRSASKPRHCLYLSFTRTLRDFSIWYSPRVPEKSVALRSGLFYFGASREGVMDREAAFPTIQTVSREKPLWTDPLQSEEAYRRFYELIYSEILVAEQEGRVLWRNVAQVNSFYELDKFLRRHGYPPMSDWFWNRSYSAEHIAEWIKWLKQAKIPLAVVF